MKIERTVAVAAMPEKVWTVMIDVEHWPEWTSSVTSVELLTGSPLVIGSRVRIRQSKLPAAVWTVTAIEPGRYFEWRNVQLGLTSTGAHRIQPLGENRSRVDLSLDWTGWLAPLINLVYGGLSRRYVQTEADGLKRRCEVTAR